MPANNSTTESGGFTAEERAAMKARAATGNDVHRQRLEEDVSGRCSGGCLCQLTGVIVGSKRRSPERRQAQEATPAHWRRNALEPCRANCGLSERSTLRMVSCVLSDRSNAGPVWLVMARLLPVHGPGGTRALWAA